jgi:hypothetical protein
LELEAPGTAQLELATGFVRAREPWRLVAPAFHFDLGLTAWFELDADGAYAIEGAPGEPFSLDHPSPDPLWTSVKVGLVDIIDDEDARSYAIGTQLGPKWPTFRGGHGVGVEGLLLGGVGVRGTLLAINVGGFVDPAPAPNSARPIAVEGGIEWSQDLDEAGRYSIGAGLSGVKFISDDPAELQLELGPTYAATEWLDVSVKGLVGFLSGGDRYGVLLAFAPHFGVWRPETTMPQ